MTLALVIFRDGDANADANANAVDARHFEDANADAFRLGEDANAEANTLIGSRVRVLYLLHRLNQLFHESAELSLGKFHI